MPPKLARLHTLLAAMPRVLIAYSGGVDSTLLLRVAVDVLGARNVLAVTEISPVYPAEETAQARQIAANLGVRHEMIAAQALTQPEFVNNPPDRCYWCKKTIFTDLQRIAAAEQIAWILDGTNMDDTGDFRPGMRAAREAGVRSPLLEAGLTKADIRELSQACGLPTWNKPSFACLASRFPYGTPITAENLRKVDAAERFLRQAGFAQVRVRHHATIARIEVCAADLPRLIAEPLRTQVLDHFSALGYTYVTADLAGYRTGSMNETL